MIPVIVIRPEPGCSASVAAARAMGLAAQGFPLFRIVPVPWEPCDPRAFDALLAGSANVFRHGGPGLNPLRALPVHAVGDATAQAAREAGFQIASTGSGGLQRVLETVPPGTALLRLAGRERVTLEPPAGVTVTERVVYASEPGPIPPDLAEQLLRPALILLHSAAAARHFASECDRLSLSRGQLALVTIGPRVSEAAGAGWLRCASAEQPSEAALLEKARDLCHILDDE